MKKRKHRFVVGYRGEGNYIFGKVQGRRIREDYTCAHPMTFGQAESMLKDLSSSGRTIFELVPVKNP